MKIELLCHCGTPLKAIQSDVRESAVRIMVAPCDNRMSHIDMASMSQWHIQLLLEAILDGCIKHAEPVLQGASHHIFDVWAKAYLFFAGHCLWYIEADTGLARSSFFLGVVFGDYLAVKYYYRPKKTKRTLFVFDLRYSYCKETQDISYMSIRSWFDEIEKAYREVGVCARKGARSKNDTGRGERGVDREEFEVIRLDAEHDEEPSDNRQGAEEHGEEE